LLLASKFGPDDQFGKTLCKKRMTEVYGIREDKPIYLTMCRLVREKGIESILSSIPTI
jgi:glycogen synthase